MNFTSLRRLRWGVRVTLALGVAVSVTANILHARPDPIAQAIAAWPPLALLITVDLVSRVPTHRRLLGAVRVTATFTIAAIAAFVSYGHMVGVTARYGETGIVPYLLPISVDGLIVVASVSLVELAGRLRATAPAIESVSLREPLVRTQPSALKPDTNAAGPLVASDAGKQPSGQERAASGRKSTKGGAQKGIFTQHGSEQRSDTNQPETDEQNLVPAGLAPDLVPMLVAAHQARNDLMAEHRAVTRDALAARLRANGHAIRTARVGELLAVLK